MLFSLEVLSGEEMKKQKLQDSFPRTVPFTALSKSRAHLCPYVRFTPQDEDFCHHTEELVRISVRAFEPVRSELKSR